MKRRTRLALCLLSAALAGSSTIIAQAPESGAPAPEAAAMAAATSAQAALPPAAPITLGATQTPGDLTGCQLVVRIPNLRGTLATAQAVLQKGMPGVPLQLTEMVAEKLKDPGLAGFPDGAGIAMVVPDKADAMNVTVLEVTGDQLAAYEGRLKADGFATEQVGGLLAVAQTPEILATAHSYIEKNAATLMGDGSKTGIVADVNAAAIIKLHGAEIEAKIAEIPAKFAGIQAQRAQVGMPPSVPSAGADDFARMGKMGEGEARLFYNMAKEVDTMRVEIDLNSAGLAMTGTTKALPGTNLATLLSAPKPAADTKIAGLIPGGGMVVMAGESFNSAAMIDYFVAQGKLLCADMKIAESESQPVLDMLTQAKSIYGGAMAVSFGAGGGIMDCGFVVDCSDPAGALAFFERTPEMMKQPGMDKLLKTTGQTMSISYQKDARQYNGVAIHKLTEDIKYDDPEQAKQVAALLGSSGHYEFEQAFVDHYLVQGSGAVKIETLIDAVKSGANPAAKPLKAMSDFAPGAEGFMDFDLGAMVQKIAQMAGTANPQAAAPMMMVSGMFAGTPPITMAWQCGPDASRKGVLIPADLIARVGGQAMMMATMMGGMGGPGMAPGGPGM